MGDYGTHPAHGAADSNPSRVLVDGEESRRVALHEVLHLAVVPCVLVRGVHLKWYKGMFLFSFIEAISRFFPTV